MEGLLPICLHFLGLSSYNNIMLVCMHLYIASKIAKFLSEARTQEVATLSIFYPRHIKRRQRVTISRHKELWQLAQTSYSNLSKRVMVTRLGDL